MQVLSIVLIACYFLTFRNPNQPVSVPAVWPMYNISQQAYIELDADMGEHSSKQLLDARPTNFWLDVVPGLLAEMDNQGTEGCVSAAGQPVVTFMSFAVSLMATCFWYFSQ